MKRWHRVVVLLITLGIAGVLIIPSVKTLYEAEQPMPVPEQAIDMALDEVEVEQLAPDWTDQDWVGGPLQPDTIYVPALQIKLPFIDAGATRGWADVVPEVDKGIRMKGYGDFTKGSQIFASHVNNRYRQTGPLATLVDTKAGMVVIVTDADATPFEYVTTGLDYYHKMDLPKSIFDREGSPTIHLVTCGGPIERSPIDGLRHYRDNVVLRAEALNPPKPEPEPTVSHTSEPSATPTPTPTAAASS